MQAVLQSLSGIADFALYFAVSLLLLLIFKVVYTLITPHDEWKLVKEDKNFDKIGEIVKELLPKIKVFIFDSDMRSALQNTIKDLKRLGD